MERTQAGILRPLNHTVLPEDIDRIGFWQAVCVELLLTTGRQAAIVPLDELVGYYQVEVRLVRAASGEGPADLLLLLNPKHLATPPQPEFAELTPLGRPA